MSTMLFLVGMIWLAFVFPPIIFLYLVLFLAVHFKKG